MPIPGTVELRGRDAERRVLSAALDDACGGHGTIAVVSGPAGIGKSSLAEALAAEAAARGVSVVRGRAWEFADAPPYFPVAAALRSLGVEASSVATSEFALWEHVLENLAKRESESPLLWLVEDLHAADLQTLDLLVFLAQPIRSLRMLVVATTRMLDPRGDDRSRQRLTRLAREGVEVALAPLAKAEVAAVAKRWMGRDVEGAELDELVRRSDGNPLFVVELARATTLLGAPGHGGALPTTIRQLVIERVVRLPDASRRALEAGAIVGREFAAGVVARMLDSLPAGVIDALLPVLRAGLVVESQPGTFSFSHILERDAIEESLPSAARAALHQRAEVALRAAGDAPQVWMERARHALAGTLAGGNEADTLALVAHAISELNARGAYDRAFSLVRRLREARAAGTISTPSSSEELLRAAKLAAQVGQHAESQSLCLEVTARARTARDAPLLARAAILMGAEIRPGVVDARLVGHLREAQTALAAASPRDEALECLVDARLAAALQPAPQPALIVESARAAIARARALKDDAVLAEVLVMAGSALVDFAPVAERMTLARELLERAERTFDREKVLRARARLAIDEIESANFAGFSTQVDAMLDVSLELGQPRHRWRPLLFASMRACMVGHFDESERLLVEVEQLAYLIDDPALSLSLPPHRSACARESESESGGRLREIASQMSEPLGIASRDAVLAMLRAHALARTGDRQVTEAELAKIGSRIDDIVQDSTFASMMVEAATLVGDKSICEGLGGYLAPLSTAHATGGHVSIHYEGPVIRLLGLLDVVLGDEARAESRLRDALTQVRALNLRPWIARTATDLGELLERRGAKVESAALLHEASTIAHELGMINLVERLTRDEAPPSPAGTRPTAVTLAGLTVEIEREGETWCIRRGDRSARVRDSRGIQLLARLVAQPGEEIHVLVLAGDEGTLVEGDAGARIDDKALKSYRARLAELARDIDTARAHADLGRVDRLEREKTAIEREIAGGLGLGGRARKTGSVTERARVNVQRRLKDAISRITEADPALGRELDRAVRTGTYCSFRP